MYMYFTWYESDSSIDRVLVQYSNSFTSSVTSLFLSSQASHRLYNCACACASCNLLALAAWSVGEREREGGGEWQYRYISY